MQLTTEPLLGDPTLCAALYGPLVLTADLGAGPKDGPLKIGGASSAPKASEWGPAAEAPTAPTGDAAQWIEVSSAKNLVFKASQKSAPPIKPLFSIADEKYAVYWGTPATEKKA